MPEIPIPYPALCCFAQVLPEWSRYNTSTDEDTRESCCPLCSRAAPAPPPAVTGERRVANLRDSLPDPASTPTRDTGLPAAPCAGADISACIRGCSQAPRCPAFTVYEVNGHRLRRTGTALVASDRAPDSYWFGNRPQLLSERRGDGAGQIIDRIEDAIARYPYAGTYRVWPGPNSNTFTAFILRDAPELRVDLPPTAIGKDYLGVMPVATLPSGTGLQLSVLGVAGVAAGWEEGLEVNLLGLTFGVDRKACR